MVGMRNKCGWSKSIVSNIVNCLTGILCCKLEPLQIDLPRIPEILPYFSTLSPTIEPLIETQSPSVNIIPSIQITSEENRIIAIILIVIYMLSILSFFAVFLKRRKVSEIPQHTFEKLRFRNFQTPRNTQVTFVSSVIDEEVDSGTAPPEIKDIRTSFETRNHNVQEFKRVRSKSNVSLSQNETNHHHQHARISCIDEIPDVNRLSIETLKSFSQKSLEITKPSVKSSTRIEPHPSEEIGIGFNTQIQMPKIPDESINSSPIQVSEARHAFEKLAHEEEGKITGRAREASVSGNVKELLKKFGYR
jgi:hypothetical protein